MFPRSHHFGLVSTTVVTKVWRLLLEYTAFEYCVNIYLFFFQVELAELLQ